MLRSYPSIFLRRSELDLAAHHAQLIRLVFDGHNLASDALWTALPAGNITVKLGDFTLCFLQVIQTDAHAAEDPIVSPTQPWCSEDDDPEFDHLQEIHRTGFFHVAEYVCQDEEPRQTGKILLVQQDGTFEWGCLASMLRWPSRDSMSQLAPTSGFCLQGVMN